MKVLTTGSRDWGPDRYRQVYRALAALSPMWDEVILGDAPGVDALAYQICRTLGLRYHREEAEWERYRKAAGPKRNAKMLDHQPDQVWWFHDDIVASRGTKNCVQQAQARGIHTEQK